MIVAFARNLLFGRHDRFDSTEVNMDHARVRALLDDAGHYVTLAAAEFTQHRVIRQVAQTLVDNLLRRERRDPTEVVRAVDGLTDDIAFIVVLRHVYVDVAGLAVEFDARSQLFLGGLFHVLARVNVLEVGRQNCLLNDSHEFLVWDLFLALHLPQHAEVDVHGRPPLFRSCRRDTAQRAPLYGTGIRGPSSP